MITASIKVKTSPDSSFLFLQKGVEYLKLIRKYEGCNSIQLNLDVEHEGEFNFHSNWESIEYLNQYLQYGLDYEIKKELNLRSLISHLDINLISHQHKASSFDALNNSIQLSQFSKQIKHKIKLRKSPATKYASSHLSKEQIDQFLGQIRTYMRNHTPFQNQDLTLVNFANEVGLHSHHVSRVINEKLQMNFSDFINSYRVELAKDLLLQDLFKKYTISGIGNEAGFNSRSAFYNAFRKFTGMSPGEFINNHQVQVA